MLTIKHTYEPNWFDVEPHESVGGYTAGLQTTHLLHYSHYARYPIEMKAGEASTESQTDGSSGSLTWT